MYICVMFVSLNLCGCHVSINDDVYAGGIVALSVEYRTCDREVVGSSLGRACGVETMGKFLTPVCLCSPSSTSWYRPKGGDALLLGSKGRYGL